MVLATAAGLDATRSQMRLERIHIGWQVCDLTELVSKPGRDDEGDEVKAGASNQSVVGSLDEVFAQLRRAANQGSPMHTVIDDGNNTKREQSETGEIKKRREDHVAGRRGG